MTIPKVLLCVLLVALVGCTINPTKPTDPLKNVVIQEVLVPIPVCPKEAEEIVYPVRPALAIDELTVNDKGDFQKVGQAYMQTVADLQAYAGQLEDIAYSIKGMCKAVNNNNIGK